jgi:hypothetical protein
MFLDIDLVASLARQEARPLPGPTLTVPKPGHRSVAEMLKSGEME